MDQLILETKTPKHSEKPQKFRDLIVELLDGLPRLEMFARTNVESWDAWENQLDDQAAA